ncbi:MAG: O-antigen ligase family protein [Candidatus Tectomicrobia bacterium]|nr:O-antigen ligase family protein [Candidatus Tectomicrobia bacterium]
MNQSAASIQNCPKSPLFWIVSAAYWTLAVITLLNLNLVGRMGFGVERAFSPLILACCLILILIGALSVPWLRALGVPGFCFIAALTSYLAIGSLVGFATELDSHPDKEFWYFLSSYAKTVVVVVAAAFGSCIVLRGLGAERLLGLVLLLMILNCLLILVSPFPLKHDNRLSGTIGNSNYAGLYGCLTVALTLSFIWSNPLQKLARWGFPLCTLAAIGTFSRTAMLILFLLFLRFLTGGARMWKPMIKWLLLASIAVLVGGAIVGEISAILDDDQRRRLKTLAVLGQEGLHDSSFNQRFLLMNLALDEVSQSPIVGSGLGNLHRLDNAPLNKLGLPLGAHNQYLVIIGEGGVVPLVFLMVFLAFLLLPTWKMTSVADSAVAAWTLVLALFFLTTHTILLQRFSNFLIGLSCALLALGTERNRGSVSLSQSK